MLMKNRTFWELEDPNHRLLAVIVSKSKAWSSRNSNYIFLDEAYQRYINGQAGILTRVEDWEGTRAYQIKNLWWDFHSQKKRQMKYRAELTRYMKKFKTANELGKTRLQSIVAGIVKDLAEIQEEFNVWQKEVEEVLK